MNKLMIKLINWYRKKISPNDIPRCRHTPTCSNYALTAYKRFNFFKASFLSLKRILTCNPLFKGKHDPVPENNIKHPRFKYSITNTHYKEKT